LLETQLTCIEDWEICIKGYAYIFDTIEGLGTELAVKNREIKLELVLKIVERYDNNPKKRTRPSAYDDKVVKRTKTMIPVVGTEHTVTGAFADDRWSTSKFKHNWQISRNHLAFHIPLSNLYSE
jgi:hypothetical protein